MSSQQFGYPGIFLIALMANATVHPACARRGAIIYAMGAVFNPLWVALAAGTGGAHRRTLRLSGGVQRTSRRRKDRYLQPRPALGAEIRRLGDPCPLGHSQSVLRPGGHRGGHRQNAALELSALHAGSGNSSK
ncbi:MAG: hypothetical protein MZV70_21275 [Desulfobacterales bacterium]|nr:hypothetical protein [Desulfobacterales bacterium]